ncbi:VWA domain-containing protein [Motilibacter aurantiacus]|uniref:VWA domain-containing protein n=1 Tax=Motilibacter aurantiacus TaxID=2714955 RepID=UPI00140795FB|nr:VWA domain-containing protein [Motilibacter aurantiacus]
MSFLAPERLLLLLGVAALAAAYVAMQRRRTEYAVRFTNLDLLDRVAPRRPGWRRHVPAAAFVLMLVLLVVGFARPEADVRVPRERATILVAVDVSLSMQAEDVEPDRFVAAKRAASSFVAELPDSFDVGLVAFSGAANVVVSPTQDHDAVRAGVDALQLGPSTAIGEAVFTSLNSIAATNSRAGTGGARPPARVVLLSDGSNTVGRSLEEAAAAAREAAVPVSTIAYGTDDGMVLVEGRPVPVPVDRESLAELAQATGGRGYTAQSEDQLTEVYRNISGSVGYRTERREVAAWFVGAGLLMALAAAAASLRWFARLP